MWKIIPSLKLAIPRFSTLKISSIATRNAHLQKQIRSIISIQQAIETFDRNRQEIEKIGKTVFLQFLNEFYMEQRITKCEKYKEMFRKITTLTNLNLYEQGIRLSIMNKMKIYFFSPHERKQLDNIIAQKIDQAIAEMHNQSLSFSQAMNMLFVYQIYAYPRLLSEILKIIDSKIGYENMSNDNYANGWSIFFTQLSRSPWKILRQCQNILKYICDDYSCYQNENNIPLTINNFCTISQLKLHLVGPKKLPKSLNQTTQILAKCINQRSAAQVCRLLRAYNYLPATFNPHFKAQLIRKLLSFQKSPLMYTLEVPLNIFSEKQIEYIFPTKDTYEFLWKLFIYEIQSQNPTRFFKGKIIKILQIQVEENSKQTLNKNAAKICISRLISAGRLFAHIKNEKVVKKIRQFCYPYFRKQLRNTIQDFSYLNMINIFYVYPVDEYKQFRNVLKKNFYATLKSRSTKIRFNNHYINAQKAITQNINSEDLDIKEIVHFMLEDILESSDQFNFDYEAKVLFALFSSKYMLPQKYTAFINRFVKKLMHNKQQNLRILADYFLLEENKDPMQVRNMLDFLIKNQCGLQLLLNVISSSSVSHIMNSRGNLNSAANKYFQSAKIDFKISGDNIHIVDRAHTILSYFPSVKTFTEYLYLQAMDSILNEIMDQNWSLRESSSRIYVDFLLKGQLLIQPKMSEQAKRNILQKIRSGLLRLMKFDHQIYLKARYTEFVIMHKETLQQKQGIQIQKLHKVQKALRITSRPQQLILVHLIILKLYCLGYEDISEKDASQYSTSINSAITSGKINLLIIKDQIQYINHVIPLATLSNASKQKVKSLFIPLVMRCLEISTQSDQYYIAEPIMKFFNYLRAQEELHILLNYIQVKYLAPSQIIYILTYFPFNVFQQKFLDDIAKTIISKAGIFDQKIFMAIYFYQANYETIPQNLSEALYKKAQKQLDIIQAKVKTKNLNIRQTLEQYGYFPFYIFGCIKNQKIKDNKLFQHLISLIRSYPRQFKQRKNSTQKYKFIHQSIVAYALKDYKQNKSKAVSIEKMFRSAELQNYLQSQNQVFQFQAVVNNVQVPYYLPEKETIILHLNYSKIQMIGYFRFKAQMYKYLTDKNVKIFNTETREIRQI